MLGFTLLLLLGLAAVAGINLWVIHRGRPGIVHSGRARPADAVLVLGAYVFPEGEVSGILRDRLDTGLELYRSGKAGKLIVSGDHGQTDYDEVNAMRVYLERHGVPAEDIFMDHAGFDTYDSMYRARHIFQVKSLIVVTQDFHLHRALYIASSLELAAQGVRADRSRYPSEASLRVREVGARVKAFGEVLMGREPVFLGPIIAISGDGRRTHDRARKNGPEKP